MGENLRVIEPLEPTSGQYICVKYNGTNVTNNCSFYDSLGNTVPAATLVSDYFAWETEQTITKITYDGVNYLCNLPQEHRMEQMASQVPDINLDQLEIEGDDSSEESGGVIVNKGKIYLGELLISNPPNGSITITENGTIDIADYETAVVNVSGGGSLPTITNPINGEWWSSSFTGTLTHQYQVSSGSISSCSLACTSLNPNMYVYGDLYVPSGAITYTFPYHDLCNWPNDLTVNITDSGLLTVTTTRTSSQVTEYPWLEGRKLIVMITLDSGAVLIDTITPLTFYSCLLKDTLIALKDGSKKPIQDIDYNDELLVWNFDEGRYDSAKPLWIKKAEVTNWYYKLTFSDGKVLKVTGAYPEAHSLFSVKDGKFIHSNRLVGKETYTLDGVCTLVSCEEIREEVEYYNIFTEYHLNMFANDILTSTSLNNLYPIKDMKFIKEKRNNAVDYSKFEDKWIKGARLCEQRSDVTEYVKAHINLSK